MSELELPTSKELFDLDIRSELGKSLDYKLLYGVAQALLKMHEEDLCIAQEQSLTDPLTGIKNRRAFEEDLNGELSLAARNSEDPKYKAGALMLIDLDDFKETNDTHGHPMGDEVLKNAASVLSESVRIYDGAYRLGGDEFAVILDGSDEEHAMEVARRIGESIYSTNLEMGLTVSASIGVGVLTADDTKETIYNYVDRALYEAKDMKDTGMLPIVAASTLSY